MKKFLLLVFSLSLSVAAFGQSTPPSYQFPYYALIATQPAGNNAFTFTQPVNVEGFSTTGSIEINGLWSEGPNGWQPLSVTFPNNKKKTWSWTISAGIPGTDNYACWLGRKPDSDGFQNNPSGQTQISQTVTYDYNYSFTVYFATQN